MTHTEFAKKAGISTLCTAHHINFGGGCLSCGWLPEYAWPERKPRIVAECWTCQQHSGHDVRERKGSGRLSGFPLNMDTLSLANDLQALLETYSHQYERKGE